MFEQYGLAPDESDRVARALATRPEAWVDFMMRFELGLDEPDPKRAVRSALTIAVAYVIGGLVPLAPHMFISTASAALLPLVFVTLVALIAFGFIKGRFTGTVPWKSALQTAVIGSLAAGAAFGIARAMT